MSYKKVFEKSLNESSLSRVWKQSQEHDAGTITAFRYASNCGKGNKFSISDNKKGIKNLKHSY